MPTDTVTGPPRFFAQVLFFCDQHFIGGSVNTAPRFMCAA